MCLTSLLDLPPLARGVQGGGQRHRRLQEHLRPCGGHRGRVGQSPPTCRPNFGFIGRELRAAVSATEFVMFAVLPKIYGMTRMRSRGLGGAGQIKSLLCGSGSRVQGRKYKVNLKHSLCPSCSSHKYFLSVLQIKSPLWGQGHKDVCCCAHPFPSHWILIRIPYRLFSVYFTVRRPCGSNSPHGCRRREPE